MKEIELPLKNETKDIKLYSAGAIGGATFLGGPLAAGYLISENFKALNKPDAARTTMILGVITSILLFGGLFTLPEKIIDKIPGQIIPMIYTAIIWGIVEWKIGGILKAHKENNNLFFSAWRAAGVGLISLVLIGIGIVGYTLLATDNEQLEQYDLEIAQFSENENQTLGFYDTVENATPFSLLQELDQKTIPKWKENIAIIRKISAFDNLPSELRTQNEILLKYSELRLQAFELFRKAIKEDTDEYIQELEQLHFKIDKELEKLN